MIAPWFLYLQGFAMVIMGVALLGMRPRPPGASFYVRFVNLGTLWALVCCAVGAGLLAMALGYLTPFGAPPAVDPSSSPRAPLRHRR